MEALAPEHVAQAGLQVAVEQLYAVFVRYPLPQRIGFCDHRIDDEEVHALRRVPL